MATVPGQPGSPLRVAIVGSGPSGFYAAEALLKQPHVEVDMIEALPVPFGLVRYGVAPDHARLKQPMQVFDGIARSAGFRFFGNVPVGRAVSVDELRGLYHAVLFTYGASDDRRLGIAGEDLPGSHSAREFVGWYNGHPADRDRVFDLSDESAVVIGQGNVAVDVTRILARPVDELRSTDICEHAIEALSASRVREIHLVGRRGPAQARFTGKELRELGELTGCSVEVAAADLDLGGACIEELADKRNFVAAKNVEIFRSWSGRGAAGGGIGARRIVFHFQRIPVELRGNGRLRSIVLEKGALHGAPFQQAARGTGDQESLRCGLLFRSIGYRGSPIEGLPFDSAQGLLPNRDGRIGDTAGLYTAGWIKRGPSGIIGTNRADAVATVATLISDLPRMEPVARDGGRSLMDLLESRGTRVVQYEDWRRIDAAEIEKGARAGKPREKFTRVGDMLALLH